MSLLHSLGRPALLVAVAIATAMAGAALWYFDPFHDSVERLDDLIGKNYDYAYKMYFRTDHDQMEKFDIRDGVTEFRVGVLSSQALLRDNVIREYTWIFSNHKATVWVAKTDGSNNTIIDAIRYKNGVVF